MSKLLRKLLILASLVGCSAPAIKEPLRYQAPRTISIHNPYRIAIQVWVDDQDYGLCDPSKEKEVFVKYNRVQVKLRNPKDYRVYRIYTDSIDRE